ncbi:hypothetical protein [Pedobacter jeongneungensis]|uniref:hypothetical protein n=1 Tax=Pedobacter jeongneungensis TaxID=947309 RepID=UPI00046A6D40|nr:hypothetical protein [Pedobacter jeongneungensis]
MVINENKGSQDKIHSTTENSEINKENLSYDKNKESYELDVKGTDSEYDHPMGYETVAAGAKDDDSTYDEANPYPSVCVPTDRKKIRANTIFV